VHFPLLHTSPLEHATHACPPLPQALLVVPGSHRPAEQHPVAHDVELHVHMPLTHASPLGQEPELHVPPQPSLAPHALPVQLGVHPHVPLWPPPPQLSGEAHAWPAQHGCPLPPHVPQLAVPHWVPPAQAAHATPPWPQALWLVPDSHVAPLQHPEHDVGSQRHDPATHLCPVAQLPSVHTPAQPSLAPQALPVQLGVHVPVPQTLGLAPAPQVWPMLHPPHSTIGPQWLLSCPHLPAQSGVVSHPPSPASGLEASLEGVLSWLASTRCTSKASPATKPQPGRSPGSSAETRARSNAPPRNARDSGRVFVRGVIGCMAPQSPVTGTGTELSVVVPLPSWPLALDPQH
jgi:hypothetical protein